MKVMDRMPLAMLCGDSDGALLRVQPLNKLEAQELASRNGIDLIHPKPYTSDKITSALGVPPVADPSAKQNEPILVCDVLGYNHVRFFLVEKIADASGVTDDGEVILERYEHQDGIACPRQFDQALDRSEGEDGIDPFAFDGGEDA